VLVEAAFVLPVVILIVFGIIEFGLAFKDALTVSSATRAGARTATALTKQTTYADDTATAVAGALQNVLPADSPQYLSVYHADSATGDPVDGSFETCTTCYRYTWNPSLNSGRGGWAAVSGPTWLSTSQYACGDNSTMYIGIYVRAKHVYITKLFGSSVQIKDHTVMRLEPVPSATGCKNTTTQP
jgi:hypothetical protein